MINSSSFNPKSGPTNGQRDGEVLKKLQQEYALPEDKSRDPVKKLGKDEFFKLMVTQIKNQDPTSPYKNEQMAAQMAQFTSLEQMFNVNQNLEKLADSQQPLHQLGAAGLIGKTVTSDGSHFAHTEGKYSGLNFELPVDASKVKIAILNQKGEVIREIEQSDLKQGPNRIDWDGRRSNTMMAPSGSYSMRVTAESHQGKSINVSLSKKFLVHGVGFEGKETVLLTGDPKNPQKILMKSVSQIEDLRTPAPLAAPLGAPMALPDMAPGLEDQVVPDAEVGQSGQYVPLDPATIRAVSEKPTVLPQPTTDDLRRALSQRDDLSDANPYARGAPLPQAAQQNDGNEINPAALRFANLRSADANPNPNPNPNPINIDANDNSLAGALMNQEDR